MKIYVVKPAMFTYKVGLESAVVLAESKSEALKLLIEKKPELKDVDLVVTETISTYDAKVVSTHWDWG